MMAGKSKHEKADRGRRSHSTYEQRHPQKPADAPGPSGREGAAFPSAPSHAPELFPRLFQASGDGIVLQEVCSPPGGGRFLEVNDGLCRMPGYTRDEILALMPFEVLGAEARTALAELVEKGTDTPRAFFETTLVAKDGSRIPVEVHTSRLQFQERPLVLSILRDITVRR
jgi:PAS domain S-box-containing protein